MKSGMTTDYLMCRANLNFEVDFGVNGAIGTIVTCKWGLINRKNSSTELAALELIDRLLAQLKNHMIPINFHLDLAKAFDSLNHDILLDKLSHYGVNGTAKTLLKSYLSDRKQYVKIDEVKSSIQTIKTGVPQGSIVGPLIFNNFINDIINSRRKFNFILYADDTTLNSTLESFGRTTDEIQ